ncbi:hypothetical protein KY289_035677 [Solanum tuberosum]|nr:hypothetical protein KY289_035677 [Solanum tuberosum]
MPGKPGKKRRKSKDKPKKYGKLSRKGVKMTCPICKKIDHNKVVCAKYERGSTSQPDSQRNLSQQSYFQTGKQSSQQSSITTVVPRTTQTGTSSKKGSSWDWEEKKANARGITLVTERDNSFIQLLPLSGHKRPYSSASFVAATGGNRRLATDFGVYFDPTTGAQIFNSGTSSEKIPHGPTKLKSASPINIYIDFKPRGLKWKGKDAISTSQLQQMKANRKNKGSCGTSKK